MRKSMIVVTAALLALTGTLSAQDWPSSRVITMIIPFAPGGGVDASGRIQAQRMGELLGQTIIVENVGAGAGTVGSQRVAKATPDGYTMLMGNTGTHAYSQGLRKNPPYNSVTDFAPVGLVTNAIRLGNVGKRRLRAGSKSPSAESFSRSFRSASSSAPTPFGSSSSTTSW